VEVERLELDGESVGDERSESIEGSRLRLETGAGGASSADWSSFIRRLTLPPDEIVAMLIVLRVYEEKLREEEER
jgi:hypothetical protein